MAIISGWLPLSAHAADSFDINISGVINPAACTVDITGEVRLIMAASRCIA